MHRSVPAGRTPSPPPQRPTTTTTTHGAAPNAPRDRTPRQRPPRQERPRKPTTPARPSCAPPPLRTYDTRSGSIHATQPLDGNADLGTVCNGGMPSAATRLRPAKHATFVARRAGRVGGCLLVEHGHRENRGTRPLPSAEPDGLSGWIAGRWADWRGPPGSDVPTPASCFRAEGPIAAAATAGNCVLCRGSTPTTTRPLV